MFGSKKNTVMSEQLETIIGKETEIKGTITSSGAVRIDGQIQGDIDSSGELVIGESGVIRAQVKARTAIIAGTVHGNVDVTEKLELLPTAKLYGDIHASTLVIGEGAIFKGACEMRPDAFSAMDTMLDSDVYAQENKINFAKK